MFVKPPLYIYLTSLSHFLKCSVFAMPLDCDRMPEQVDHCLHPKPGRHCYFERADICWMGERGSFQRND